uniref:ATP synthase complex subunit 8 n=1 Tax=Cicadellidae sp. EMHAU-2015-Zz052706 TaxID=2037760 RepID=A0A2U7NYB1_9HEMI|nr:ATP synthase F0 subunit 8 [Cicadellidae sp. EMHAU-2015-Zz052706]
MPQMAPIWWTFLLSMTFFSMILFIMIIYFSFLKELKTNYKNTKNELCWKW